MITKPPSALPKGQLRCFQCRQAWQLKDGNWHEHLSQQVFLCRPCGKARATPPAITRHSLVPILAS